MEALTLYELNRLVRGALEEVLEAEYWLQAELSEVREAYNGHCYLEFVQKDKSGRDLQAKARGVIWNNIYRLLKPMFERETGRALSPGLKVLVKVSVTFHELYGYSLTVTDIDPSYTMGDLARLRKEILMQLEAEGILYDNKELSLPFSVGRIAVISSATAAGYGDFCNQLLQNAYRLRFTVRLFPAVMQGERVESSILAALDAIMEERDRWDAVVIIRGGGASSDLTGFDTYLLAAACAQFPLPVITGIGHERDDTVIDMVAHTRVKTPTAAAAFLIQHQLETATRLEELRVQAVQAARAGMERETLRAERFLNRFSTACSQLRMTEEYRLQQVVRRLYNAGSGQTVSERHLLQLTEERLKKTLPAKLERERFRLQLVQQRCEAADPELLLKRGYSMTFCNGELVRDAASVKPGDEIVTRLVDGEVRSVVK